MCKTYDIDYKNNMWYEITCNTSEAGGQAPLQVKFLMLTTASPGLPQINSVQAGGILKLVDLQ